MSFMDVDDEDVDNPDEWRDYADSDDDGDNDSDDE